MSPFGFQSILLPSILPLVSMKLSKIDMHSHLIRNLDTTILKIMLVNYDSGTITVGR